jgi:5-methylthioadenosine/S-adenosylhomocysteine deaminase
MTESVDILLTNAIVLTMDEDLNQFDPGAVAISGDSIQAVGTDQELRGSYQAQEVIDCDGMVVMPGLVNAHTHVPSERSHPCPDDLVAWSG